MRHIRSIKRGKCSCRAKKVALSLLAMVFVCVFMENDIIAFFLNRSLTEIQSTFEVYESRKEQISLFDKRIGAGYEIPKNINSELQKIIDEGFKLHGFNQYASDQIPVQRPLLDGRSEQCKMATENYSKSLPPTSVIVIFYNEAWSTLLRTVYSILDKSPDHLITEIILVDDCSELAHLKQPLDDSMSKLPKVKIIRNQQREGLIRARIVGAVAAKGPVLTFLDSHVECTPGWLEPLLDRIAENSTNVACPMIMSINKDTFQFKMNPEGTAEHVGKFAWNLQFDWQSIPEHIKKIRKDKFSPLPSPTMAGGLFTISKEFFDRLGMYDPEFSIWGGENLELSFKTWMCGGRLEIIPCSKVGHVFRKIPYDLKQESTSMKKNLHRLAAIWMDDYAKYFYQRVDYEKVGIGNISERIKLRQDLGCKSFQWYKDNIYPNLEIPDNIANGFLKNLVNESRCLHPHLERREIEGPANMADCRHVTYFEYSKSFQIKAKDHCLSFKQTQNSLEGIKFSRCKKIMRQRWFYDNSTHQLTHAGNKKCLTSDTNFKLVFLEPCNETKLLQKWGFRTWVRDE